MYYSNNEHNSLICYTIYINDEIMNCQFLTNDNHPYYLLGSEGKNKKEKYKDII